MTEATELPEPQTTAAHPSTPKPIILSKTVILLRKDSSPSQYVFIRGGLSHANNNDCPPRPYQQNFDKCALPIEHHTTAPLSCQEYPAWSQGDNYLDFHGAEINQGRYHEKEASGTPTAWTTNDQSKKEYHPLNRYGSGYWLGFITPSPGWESDIKQGTCAGDGGSAPFQSNNHIARCGAINVFKWGSSECYIEVIPDPTLPPAPVTTQSPAPTGTQPSTSKPMAYSRTLILLQRNTVVGQFVFIRGGNIHEHVCSPGPHQQDIDPCAISIIHNTNTTCDEYQAWKNGDRYLDFEGDESGQGTFSGKAAAGTPSVWTTNNPYDKGYHPSNVYGKAFWLVELLMDCTNSYNGWFDLKGFIPGVGWEGDIKQQTCSGNAGYPPHVSKNHVARCGAVNVFYWGSGACNITIIPEPTLTPVTESTVSETTSSPLPWTTQRALSTTTETSVSQTTQALVTETTEPVASKTTRAASTKTTGLPISETTQAPATKTTRTTLSPATETTELPATETTRVPATGVSETTRGPATGTTELPASDTTQAPVTETTELPASDTTQAPVTETTELPVSETTRVPATGVSETTRECPPLPYQQQLDKCALSIRHNTTVPSTCYEYPAWSQGDNYLDFHGPETNQGRYNGQEASGTPTVWTTNDRTKKGYHPLNKYGSVTETRLSPLPTTTEVPETTRVPVSDTTKLPAHETTPAPTSTTTEVTESLAPKTTPAPTSTTDKTTEPPAPETTPAPTTSTPTEPTVTESTRAPTLETTHPSTPKPVILSRTVIFLKKDTATSQYLFIRGGLSHANNNGMVFLDSITIQNI
ncbi:hypothetical protein OESDEN_07692 [Oesophagostomum dentatum]|uniref:Uncharacterized protein n=1 Tax=Oesophagostomum dentatum TaxID=61180 RepID=A0A0B1T8D8_OESDE|nr:hypothetical protein OESDEN_07692 [Oesophagostomum dentatum]